MLKKSTSTVMDIRYIQKSGEVLAYGRILPDGKFLVFKGSRACELKPSGNSRKRKELEEEGVIKKGMFERDYTFDSLSAAAIQVLGRSAGPIEWRKNPSTDSISKDSVHKDTIHCHISKENQKTDVEFDESIATMNENDHLHREEMTIKWSFPAFSCPYEKKGLNDSGIETFSDNILRSLAREICQNSLDAKSTKLPTNPVVVKFSRFSIDNHLFPGREHLKSAFIAGRAFWGSDEKTKRFCDIALASLNASSMTWLRISDFNTIGLNGIDKDCSTAETTPWSSLVMSSGVSNKTGISGGSFGIGKFATFSCSKLRTSFYATLTEEGKKGWQGVCRWVTFKNQEGNNTTGLGYYSNKGKPILDLPNVDPSFRRENPGTDIYIPAFLASDDWFSDIKSSVLDGFLYAILNKKLVVELYDEKCGNLIINDVWLREQYCNNAFDNESLKQNYEALTSNSAYVSEKDFGDDGKIELRLILAPNLDRRIAMIRETGMKIFPKGHFSSSISFSGVLIVLGDKLNSRIKKFENPQHTKWERNRNLEDGHLLDSIYAFCREKLSEFVKSREEKELDARLGSVLPALLEKEGEDEAEALTVKISQIDSPKVRRKKISKKSVDENPGSNLGLEEEDGVEVGTGGGIIVPGPNSSLGKGGGGEARGDNTDNLPRKLPKEVEIGVKKLRFICQNKETGDYLLLLTPAKCMSNGIIKVFAMAELSVYPASIISAKLSTGEPLEILEENCVTGLTFEKDVGLKIHLKMNYSEYVSLEADCYGVII